MKVNKILIIAGGLVKKLDDFIEPAKDLGLDVTLSSFYDINFSSDEPSILRVGDQDLADFDVVYIRMVGKRLETATLLVNYLKEKNIKIVDSAYQTASLIPSTISKAVELSKLIENNIPVPKTIFGRLSFLAKQGAKDFGFPFVIKVTEGRKARDVWAPRNQEELDGLLVSLYEREKKGESFFAQVFVEASQRLRTLVINGKVYGGITRPTKWRRRFIEKINGEFPEGTKESVKNIPADVLEVSLDAAKAVSLEIAGIDILIEDKTDNKFIIEANAAPAWNLIKQDTGVEVEKEILNFLANI